MFPPTLSLAVRPGNLALSTAGPHLAAALTMATTHAASNVALQSYRVHEFQIARARQFHWWCRRTPPRRYSSWGRHGSWSGDRPSAVPPTDPDKAAEDVSSEDKRWRDETVTARERHRYLVDRLMRRDPYETVFGASNRMLKGVKWPDWPQAQEIVEKMRTESRRMRDEGLKELERMEGPVLKWGLQREMMRKWKTVAAREDEAIGGVEGKKKEGMRKTDEGEWAYDAVSGRMILKKNALPGEKVEIKKKEKVIAEKAVEIDPVKPFSIKFDQAEVVRAISKAANSMAGKESAQSPISKATSLPSNDEGLRSASHRASTKDTPRPSNPSVEQKAKLRSALEADFIKNLEAKTEDVVRPIPKSSRANAFTWKLQRQQLEDAAKDLTIRENIIRKQLRQLSSAHTETLGAFALLKERCDELARKGVFPPSSKALASVNHTLEADLKVIEQAKSLLDAAVFGPELPQIMTFRHVPTSLDRYAWDRRPFSKILDAKTLVQNTEKSLATVNETLEQLRQRVETEAKLESTTTKETEVLKMAVQDIEEKRHKRDNEPVVVKATTPEVATVDSDPASSALGEQVNIGRDDVGEPTLGAEAEVLAVQKESSPVGDGFSANEDKVSTVEDEKTAMPLGAIPDVEFASMDGGPDPKPVLATETAKETTANAAEDVYTVLSLDQTAGSITTATMYSSAKASPEDPIPLATALRQLAQPAAFLPHLEKLTREGFVPVEALENLLMMKKIASPAAAKPRLDTELQELADSAAPMVAADAGSESTADTLAATPDSETSAAASEDSSIVSKNAPSTTGSEPEPTSSESESYYSTRLQSPHPGTVQGLRPKKTEPVFSGTLDGHGQYEHLHDTLGAIRHKGGCDKSTKRRGWRWLRKWARTALYLTIMAYMIGTLVELDRMLKERLAARKKRREEMKAMLNEYSG